MDIDTDIDTSKTKMIIYSDATRKQIKQGIGKHRKQILSALLCSVKFCPVSPFPSDNMILSAALLELQLSQVSDGDRPTRKPKGRTGDLPGDLPESWPQLRLPRGTVEHRLLLLPLYLPHLAVHQRPDHLPESLVLLPAAAAIGATTLPLLHRPPSRRPNKLRENDPFPDLYHSRSSLLICFLSGYMRILDFSVAMEAFYLEGWLYGVMATTRRGYVNIYVETRRNDRRAEQGTSVRRRSAFLPDDCFGTALKLESRSYACNSTAATVVSGSRKHQRTNISISSYI